MSSVLPRYTRAVFVEFTVYNAQVNLFGIVTLLAEFLNSGGIVTSHRIEPMNLLGYSSTVYAFQIACEVCAFIDKCAKTSVNLQH